MNKAEELRDKYRHDVKELCDEFVKNVDAYLESCKGKRFRCTTHEHPMDGKVLTGFLHYVQNQERCGVSVVGAKYQPLWFSVNWVLIFEGDERWSYTEDCFGFCVFE